MDNRFERTQTLLGEKAFKKLNNSYVAVFGLGGVGGYVVEALARSGVSKFDLVDNDTISKTNLNRQIIALADNVGNLKTEEFKKRILKINDKAIVNTISVFFTPQNSCEFDFSKYDYVIDAIDTVSAKIEIARLAQECKTPVISSMGTGNKLDPTQLKISDIKKTDYCPLARVMRNLCKKNGIKNLKVIYSTEVSKKIEVEEDVQNGRHSPASYVVVPAVAGLMIAGEVIKDLTKNTDDFNK